MNINVTLDEPLTSNNCVKLVIELLKYILYQKQQIPFTYDSLSQLQMKSTDRNLSSIKTLLSTLKTTSEQLNLQFHLKNCKIKEIAILIGATIISPKLHVRIIFPSDILNSQEHFECKHASRKPLLNLMRLVKKILYNIILIYYINFYIIFYYLLLKYYNISKFLTLQINARMFRISGCTDFTIESYKYLCVNTKK